MIKLIFFGYYPFPADRHRTFLVYFIDKYILDENEIQLVCLKTKVVSNSSVTVYLITRWPNLYGKFFSTFWQHTNDAENLVANFWRKYFRWRTGAGLEVYFEV